MPSVFQICGAATEHGWYHPLGVVRATGLHTEPGGMGHPDASLLMYSPFLDSGPEPSLNPQNRLSAAMALPGILRAPKKFFLESEYAEL